MWTWSTGKGATANPNTAYGTGSGSVCWIFSGVWWLRRRRRQIPEVTEVIGNGR